MAKPYIVERDNKVYVRIPYKDSSGKWKQKWEKAESKTEANKRVRELLDKRDKGSTSFENKDTLEQYLDKWLVKRAKHRVTKSTLEDYTRLLEYYVRPALGKKKLSQIQRGDVKDFIADMQEKKYSARTIRYAHSVLCAAFWDAVEDGIRSDNPAHKIKLPKSTQKKPKVLKPDEALAFLKACEGNRHGLIFEIALLTGLRPEEYLALQWPDINFKEENLTINRTIKWGKWHSYQWEWGEGKTENSRRTIPIPSYLVKKLSEHRIKQLEYRMSKGEEYQNFDLVFASERGTPLPLDRLRSRHFKAILKDAKLPHMRVYDLRHSFATLMLSSEGELKLKTISEMMGHSRASFTADKYMHPDESMQREASDGLVSVIFRK
jgi:integrase